MYNEITRSVIKNVEEVVSSFITCDMCGEKLKYDKERFKRPVAYYLEVTTGHNDWGNDSCESRKSLDICSFQCLDRVLAGWKEDEAVNLEKPYIEIYKTTHFEQVEKGGD